MHWQNDLRDERRSLKLQRERGNLGLDSPFCLSSPSLSLPVRGDFGKYEEWDGEAKFTWQHPISGSRKENWRGSRGWVPDLKENPEGYFSHINSSRQRDILAGDAAERERLKWGEMLLSKLGLINALGTKGLLSGFAVHSYSPVCPWQQVKNRQYATACRIFQGKLRPGMNHQFQE